MENRDWVERNEPSAELMHYVLDGKDMYCVELPYGASTAMFFTEEGAWDAARRMVEEENLRS